MDGSAAPLRVLIVDDHPVVRRGLTALLSSLPGVEVVGEAGDGAGALKEAQLLRPDVAVMDVHMPGVDGVEATRAIVAAVPSCAVLVLTMFDDSAAVVAALRAGARGYLLKGAEQEEIARAIRTVAAGDLVLGRPVAGHVVERLDGTPPATGPVLGLTARETAILHRMAAGENNAAIAAALGLAPKTVSNHVSAIFAKLRVGSRSEAIVLAREAGVGASPQDGR